MSPTLFARKGSAVPAVTEEQAARAATFGSRRVISLTRFAREEWRQPQERPVAGAGRNHRRKFSLRLDFDLHRRFHALLKAKNISGQKLLEQLLREHISSFERSGETARNGHD